MKKNIIASDVAKLVNGSKYILLGTLFTLSGTAQAATVFIDGDDVRFTYDDSTLFGSANVVGNSIFFLPTSFSASANDDDGAVITNATLNVEIEVITPGFQIETLGLFESGDYYLDGVGASADVQGMFAVTSLEKSDTSGLFPMPYREEQLFSTGALADTAGVLTEWDVNAGIDLTTISGWNSDTYVKATMENILSVTTLNHGEKAFVEKKFGGVGITVNEVPVPAAVWLFGSGLLAITGIMRRKNRS